MCPNDDDEDRPAYCDHRPLQATMIRAEAGYRIQCLNCEMIGPERESLREALRALRRTPYPCDRADNV